jgi:hypothetical protein
VAPAIHLLIRPESRLADATVTLPATLVKPLKSLLLKKPLRIAIRVQSKEKLVCCVTCSPARRMHVKKQHAKNQLVKNQLVKKKLVRTIRAKETESQFLA